MRFRASLRNLVRQVPQMLEYLLPSIASELALPRALIPATLRVRLPHLTSTDLGVRDVRIVSGSVLDEQGSLRYFLGNAVALRQAKNKIHVLLKDCQEVELGNSRLKRKADTSQYLLSGFRPPDKRVCL